MSLYGLVENVGLIICIYIVLKIILWLVPRLLAFSPFSKPIDFDKLGSWAVVTGGTDGIGAEYARQLALLGQNIIIIGRNAEKLAKMKTEIQNRSTKSPREVILIQADLSKQDEIRSAAQRLAKLASEKEIGILVNNAGVSYDYPEFFHLVENNESKFDSILNVNCASMVQLSAAVLEQMNNRNKGLVVNIGSLTGVLPMPLLSVYAASKIFVDHLSRSLYYEYIDQGVFIQHVAPCFVSSKMSRQRESFFVPSPKKFVKSALCSAFRLKETCGFFPHDVQAVLFRLVPEFILSKIIHKMHFDLKKRYLKKYKKQ